MSDTADVNTQQSKTYPSFNRPNDLKNVKSPSDVLCYCHQDKIKTIICNKDGITSDKRSSIGVALFGLGRNGVVNFENIMRTPRAKLMYVVEKCRIKSNDIKKKWNIPNESMIYTETEDNKVFADPKVDCVIICTPTHRQEELILKALKANKSVFCQKPISSSNKSISRCYELAEKMNKSLFCAFNRHFDPEYKMLKQKVKKDLGEIQIIKTCSRSSADYLRTSGGIFHDFAVHDIEMMCWIIDEYPISVYVQAHAFNSEINALNDYDAVAMMFKFKSGTTGLIDLSRFSPYGYDQRIEVFGPKGMLVTGDVRNTSISSHSENGITTLPVDQSFIMRYRKSYDEQLEHFLDSVQGFCEVSITKERVLALNRIVSACEESARTGKVVQLEWN